jgi:hypothetical protein
MCAESTALAQAVQASIQKACRAAFSFSLASCVALCFFFSGARARFAASSFLLFDTLDLLNGCVGVRISDG